MGRLLIALEFTAFFTYAAWMVYVVTKVTWFPQ